MFTKRYGQGERLFFGIHGWGGNHTTFEPLSRFLPRDAAIISPDLPGCGQSPPLVELNAATVSEAIATEIFRLGSNKITLIGNCSGAILGLLAMSRIADCINRLVLIDPFAYAPWYFKLFVSTRVGRYAYYSTFANPIGRWITNLSLRKHRAEETDLTGTFGNVNHAVSLRYLQLLTEIEGLSEFAGIRHPIDIVHGERTFGAIRRSVPMWQAIWPQARTVELQGAGHLPIQEATEGLSRIVFSDE